MRSKQFIALAALLAGYSLARAQTPLLRILDEEVRRNFDGLKKADPAPYFISYEVFENEAEAVAASLGALSAQNRSRTRTADVSVRVGSPKLDSYHRIPGERTQITASTSIPVEDSPAAIKRRLWLATDRSYRSASQRFLQVQTSQQTRAAAEDDSDDFSREEAVTFASSPAALKSIPPEWVDRVKRLSSAFAAYPEILSSSVVLVAQRETKYFVNSENSKVQQGRTMAQVMIAASAKAFDGMDLSTSDSFEAEDVSKLPKEEVIRAAIEKAAKELNDLTKAPVVDPFTGPAILSGRAAGVFFHEIFGHRIEGHRQKDETEGQTFTNRINAPVLPDFLSVTFDPTMVSSGGTFLNGSYAYDDEGVKARPVTLVDKGVLKTFLLSRSPVKGFPNSNGHGRKQAGAEAVSRQSNLIVESSKSVPDAQLRLLLRDELKRQGKPYGLYFSRVTGGYTTTGRRGLQAFTVIPLVVYRVYADGRPDELVRGVDIVGTPLQSFAKIVAAGSTAEVFNGICGAESGSVPVSAVSPAILISELEVQRKEKSFDRPPYLPAPREGK